MAKETAVRIAILGEDKTKAAFDSASKSAEKLQKKLDTASKVTNGVGNGLLAVGAAAAVGIASSAKAAAESEKVSAQTAAVIKSTGGAAQRTAQQMGDYAGKLSMISGVDDEVIQGGENLLATFTNIKGKAFDQTTKAALDMSTAMGTDLNSSVMQLGKALNDPVAGVTKLQKVGVTFTKQQKDQIAQYVKLGDTAKAQGVILGEVNREFGGSAKAAGDTAEGSFNKLKVQLGNIQENVGAAFLPLITKVFTPLAKAVGDFANGPQLKAVTDWMTKNPKLIIGLVAGIVGLGVAFKGVSIAIEAWETITKVATGVQAAFNFVMDANPIGIVVLAIAALVGGLVLFFTKTKLGKKIWKDFTDFIGTSVQDVKSFFVDALPAAFLILKSAAEAALGKILISVGKMISGFGNMLAVLGKVPGFGWAKDAAKNVQGAADKVTGLGNNLTKMADGDMANATKKAVDFKNTLNGVPKSTLTKAEADVTKAQKNVDDLKAKIATVPASKKAQLQADIADASKKLDTAKSKLDDLKSKTLTVSVNAPKSVTIPLRTNTIEVETSQGKGVMTIGSKVIALAKGGIVNRPTMALIGEAGPEAVVPLRGPNAPTAAPAQVNVRVTQLVGGLDIRQLIRLEIEQHGKWQSLDLSGGLARG